MYVIQSTQERSGNKRIITDVRKNSQVKQNKTTPLL